MQTVRPQHRPRADAHVANSPRWVCGLPGSWLRALSRLREATQEIAQSAGSTLVQPLKEGRDQKVRSAQKSHIAALGEMAHDRP